MLTPWHGETWGCGEPEPPSLPENAGRVPVLAGSTHEPIQVLNRRLIEAPPQRLCPMVNSPP